MQPHFSTPPVDTRWQQLYSLGAVSALVLLVYSLVTILIVALTGGQPAAVADIFRMLQENRWMGLLRLDLLTVLVMPLYYLLFLAFWASLKHVDLVKSTVAALLLCAGLTLFLATPSVFSYLFLSDQYAAAVTDAQRAVLLAAGEAIVASDMWHGTGALVGGLLMQSGALLISVLMLRGGVYNKATAYVGIATHGLDLAHIIVGFIAPAAGVILMAAAGPLYLVWFPLVGWRLYQIGRIHASGDRLESAKMAFGEPSAR